MKSGKFKVLIQSLGNKLTEVFASTHSAFTEVRCLSTKTDTSTVDGFPIRLWARDVV